MRDLNRCNGLAAGSFLLGTTVALRIPALLHPKCIDDEAVYYVVASEMFHGGKPYLSAIERKPPLLFWIYEAILSLTGMYNWFGLHLFAVAWVLLTMGGLYWISSRQFDRATGLCAALLYSIFMTALGSGDLAFNGELIMNLPIVLAAAIALREGGGRFRLGMLLAGALAGAAFLIKQPAGISIVPLAVLAMLPADRAAGRLDLRHSLLRLGLLGAGFAAAIAAAGFVLWRQGVLAEAMYWTIGDHDVPHGPWSLVFWTRGLGMGAAFFGACLGLCLPALASIRERGFYWQGRRTDYRVLLWFTACSMIGTSASGRFYNHYFLQLTPWLCLLGAPVLGASLSGARGQSFFLLRPRPMSALLALSAAAFLATNTIGLWAKRPESPLCRYIEEHSSAMDRIFVWGQAAHVYLEAHRRPASRYIMTFPLTGYIFGSPLSHDPGHDTSSRILPGAWANLEGEFAKQPPLFIVDKEVARSPAKYPVSDFPFLERTLEESYEVVLRSDEGVLYRRREPGTRPGP